MRWNHRLESLGEIIRWNHVEVGLIKPESNWALTTNSLKWFKLLHALYLSIHLFSCCFCFYANLTMGFEIL